MSKASYVLSLIEKEGSVYDKLLSDPKFLKNLNMYKLDASDPEATMAIKKFLKKTLLHDSSLSQKDIDKVDIDTLMKKVKERNPRKLQKKVSDKIKQKKRENSSGRFTFDKFPFSWEIKSTGDNESWRTTLYLTLPKSKVKEFENFIDSGDNEEDFMGYLLDKDLIGSAYGTGAEYSPTGQSFSHGPSKLYKSKASPNVWIISQSGGLDI
jgi:hypothetical protein